MSNRDRVAQNQAGNSGNIPKLPIEIRLSMKKNPATGAVAFALYDKESKTDKFGQAPVKGLLIGTAMELKCFDRSLGAKGLSITSAPYVIKDNVVIYDPISNGKLAQGTKAEMMMVIANRFPKADRPAVSILLYVYVFPTDKRAGGLYEITTNASIGFDELKANQKELVDNYIVLTPALYSTTDLTISKKAHDSLGPLAKDNPPKYAKISVGERIPDELYESDAVTKVLEDWKVWDEFQRAKKQAIVENPNAPEMLPDRGGAPSPPAYDPSFLDNRAGKGMSPTAGAAASDFSMDEADDLPF